MKRIIITLLLVILVCSLCIGCASKPKDNSEAAPSVSAPMTKSESDISFTDLNKEEQAALLAQLRSTLTDTDYREYHTEKISCDNNCQYCGMHADVDRKDCASAKTASGIQEGMLLAEVYAEIGNPHWCVSFVSMSSISSMIPAPSKSQYWYLLSDGNILRVEYSYDLPEELKNEIDKTGMIALPSGMILLPSAEIDVSQLDVIVSKVSFISSETLLEK